MRILPIIILVVSCGVLEKNKTNKNPIYLAAQDAGFLKDDLVVADVDRFNKKIISTKYIESLTVGRVSVGVSEISDYYELNKNQFKRQDDEALVLVFEQQDKSGAIQIKTVLDRNNFDSERVSKMIQKNTPRRIFLDKKSLKTDLSDRLFKTIGGSFIIQRDGVFVVFYVINVFKKESEPNKTSPPAVTKTIHVRLQAFEAIAKRQSSDQTNAVGVSQRRLVTLPAQERMGILTHPNWLVAHSDAMDNHAILRGKWIRERLLGGAIVDVPITVDAMLPDEPKETLRHRMRVTREESCWKCHQNTNPVGLPFEMFDHFGRWRTRELGKPVDTTGAITNSGVRGLDAKVPDAVAMLHRLADSPLVRQVFVRHAFRYFMGRNETLRDASTLRRVDLAYVKSGGSMKSLIISLLTSDSFLYRKIQKSME